VELIAVQTDAMVIVSLLNKVLVNHVQKDLMYLQIEEDVLSKFHVHQDNIEMFLANVFLANHTMFLQIMEIAAFLSLVMETRGKQLMVVVLLVPLVQDFQMIN